MVDILHRIGVTTPAPETTTQRVYDALTTVEGLAAWWTEKTTGDAGLGGELEFRFPDGGFDMEVTELRPRERVVWRVVGGPDEWVGTTIEWELCQDGDWTVVLFAHRGWREPVEFMHHCSTKWGSFLLSLKSLVEDGEGAPSPRDVKIDNWG
ncbi:SRPBCC domain-containing protein [Isoptericola sp. 4D.3]|uniref:SRPBCC domain-containing protein n=1 Tax=Isoptericola peretonis TaxID=2918523 RepID=A0ABT0J4W9_9MICO|nr:SRPBCC domain-containing protein [Isoptericola sp. 4D.3]